MKLTAKQGRSIVYGDNENWETIEEKIVEISRWSILYEGVFKHKPTGKFYSIGWNAGATGMQDEHPFDYYEPELTEVHKVEKMVLSWEPV